MYVQVTVVLIETRRGCWVSWSWKYGGCEPAGVGVGTELQSSEWTAGSCHHWASPTVCWILRFPVYCFRFRSRILTLYLLYKTLFPISCPYLMSPQTAHSWRPLVTPQANIISLESPSRAQVCSKLRWGMGSDRQPYTACLVEWWRLEVIKCEMLKAAAFKGPSERDSNPLSSQPPKP